MKGMAPLAATPEDALRPARTWLGFLQWWQRRAATAPVAEPPEEQAEDPSALQPTIYRFILRYSLRQQLMLLALTLVSFPFLYYSLVLPKTITNSAIGGKNFPHAIFGVQFDQIPYLMLLCAAFFA